MPSQLALLSLTHSCVAVASVLSPRRTRRRSLSVNAIWISDKESGASGLQSMTDVPPMNMSSVSAVKSPKPGLDRDVESSRMQFGQTMSLD